MLRRHSQEGNEPTELESPKRQVASKPRQASETRVYGRLTRVKITNLVGDVPFISPAEVERRLISGELSSSDTAWIRFVLIDGRLHIVGNRIG